MLDYAGYDALIDTIEPTELGKPATGGAGRERRKGIGLVKAMHAFGDFALRFTDFPSMSLSEINRGTIICWISKATTRFLKAGNRFRRSANVPPADRDARAARGLA